MSSTLNKKMKNPNWWIALLKGILLLVFGVWLITSPSESLKTLSLFFGLLIIIGGILEVWFAIKNREIHKNWGWALTSGILDLILGAFLVANPRSLLLLITFVVSAWLIFRGILNIRYALLLKNSTGSGWRWQVRFGVFLMVAGAILLWHPNILGFTIAFWAALGFISLGILRLVILFKAPEIKTIYIE
jgi:uncharacterized membrane protein HdeD (DUF308 family)